MKQQLEKLQKKIPLQNTIKRFWSKVEFTPSCWNWVGTKYYNGYGDFSIRLNRFLAHRFVYELLVGKIPDGLTIDHLCKNTLCVNPNHLDVVPIKENLRRGNSASALNAVKTHCPQGHEYTEKNTHMDSKGKRHCRICAAFQARERRKGSHIES